MAEPHTRKILRGKSHARGVAAGKLVETANSLIWEDFFTKYLNHKTRAELMAVAATSNLEVIFGDATSLDSILVDQCLKLIESSSRDDYAKSEISWKPAAKRKEMLLPEMKYIILRGRHQPDSTNKSLHDVAGFISFMVTYEDGYEVVYIYEIHLVLSLQGQGVGKILMTTTEDIARMAKVQKTMLTVFRSNKHAHQWYLRRGYTIDEFSPSAKVLRNGTVKESTYLILSKAPEELDP